MTSHQQWHEQVGRYAEWIADYEQHEKEQDKVKTSQMVESKYLKKEDVGTGKMFTIRTFKQENVAMENQPEQMKWIMYFEEGEKGLVMNSTNIQLAEHALGSDETDEWIGKQIVLYEDPTISFGGKLVGGIRVRRPRTQTERHDIAQPKPNGNGKTSPAAALAKAQAPKAPPPPEDGDPGYLDDGDIPF